ncbi:substrate-binding domain-containing protein [Paenibacillus radicis (ex Xue et al. 2023)]|uniref:Substrate-binding domain-containing protein n=1 Tax=Paenibacillus radicis (ex Xue et al. 2023) TaxID=2972489 RepID=A0ABT1YGW6_9BACL|nr:substrate-binding domain-containing protein [Paenibacillus radicis (ex Xue et al. 2023)]MCR8631200.1 substrate-binding domain-containing protein [Paenibacillus radicis (ex Xue et al. 2023)]
MRALEVYMIKKRACCMLALIGLIFLISCSAKTEVVTTPETKRNIALVVKMQTGDYWKTVRMGAEAAAKEFNVNLNVLEPKDEEDVSGQIALVNEAISGGTAALVLAANDYNALAEVTEQAAGQRIPVITIDSEVNSSKVRSFIGINNYDAGRKAGRKLIELTGDHSRIAVMSNGKDSRNSVQRERGLMEEIAQYPDVQVLKKEYCFSDKKLCGDQTRKIIEEHSKIDGIIALNAISSLGVANEIQKLGLAGKVKVITFDNTPEDIEFLQEGVIQATLIQNPFSMGYLGVRYAVEALGGKKIPEFIDTGTKVIDQENMFWSDNQKLLFPFVK